MNKKQNVKQEKELIASEIEKAIENEEYRRRYAIWFVNKIFKNKEWFTWSANQIHKGWEKRLCCRCQKLKYKDNFYTVKDSSIYTSGKLPICKRCINNLYQKYKVQYCNPYKAMEKICQIFDLYFDERLYRNCDWDSPNAVGIYLSKLNLRQTKYRRNYDATKKSYFYKR